MKADKLKEELKMLGWLFEKQTNDTGVDWRAFKHLDGFNDCQSNERLPAIIIEPYYFSDGVTSFESVEFSITGSVADVWVSFKVYSVSTDETIKSIPKATVLLRAAWNAVTNLNTEGL